MRILNWKLSFEDEKFQVQERLRIGLEERDRDLKRSGGIRLLKQAMVRAVKGKVRHFLWWRILG